MPYSLQPSPYNPQPSPLNRYSPSHHCVTKVTRETAIVVAPSPLGTPDEMMSLAAIEHLDFEPTVTCETTDADDDAPCLNPAWATTTRKEPA